MGGGLSRFGWGGLKGGKFWNPHRGEGTLFFFPRRQGDSQLIKWEAVERHDYLKSLKINYTYSQMLVVDFRLSIFKTLKQTSPFELYFKDQVTPLNSKMADHCSIVIRYRIERHWITVWQYHNWRNIFKDSHGKTY